MGAGAGVKVGTLEPAEVDSGERVAFGLQAGGVSVAAPDPDELHGDGEADALQGDVPEAGGIVPGAPTVGAEAALAAEEPAPKEPGPNEPVADEPDPSAPEPVRLVAADPSGPGLVELVPDGFHGLELGAGAGLGADVAHTDPADELPAEPAADEPAADDPAADPLSAGDDPAGDDPAGDEPAGDDPAGDEPAADPGTGLGLTTVVPELEKPTRFSSRCIAEAASAAVVSCSGGSATVLPPSELPLAAPRPSDPLLSEPLLSDPLLPDPLLPDSLPAGLAPAAARPSADPASSEPGSDSDLAMFVGLATGIVSEVALTLASEGVAGVGP